MSGITLDTISNDFHSIVIKDSAGDELAIAADGSIAVTDNGGSLTVDGVDFDIRDLTHVSDSVKIGDGTDFLAIAADGSIAVTDNGGSLTVDDGGTTLSIDDGGGSITVDGTVSVTDDANHLEDAAHVSGDTGKFVLAVRSDTKASTAGTDGDYAALIQDADGDLYVSDTVAQGHLTTLAGAISGSEMQVDIITMPGTQTEDAPSAGGELLMMIGGYRQDANTSPVSADGDFHGFIFNNQGELKVSSRLDDVADSSVVVTTVSVDTTAGGTQLVSSGLTSRRDLTIQNLGQQDIWVKDGTGTTAGAAGNGFLIPKGSSATYKWGPNIDLYAITASGTADVKVIEAA